MTSTGRRLAMLRLILDHPLNRNRRIRAMSRFAGWQAWRLLIRRPLTVRFWRDLKVRVHPDWPYSWTAIYLGLTEYDDMMFTLKYLRPGDAFIDVGANIGYYSLLASSANEGAAVLAYEPHPTGSRRLRENAQLNRFENIVVRAVALGGTDGVAQLTTALFDENRIQVPGHDADSVEVPMVTLDGDLRQNGIDPASVAVVKIDTEGYEASVLAGAGQLLATRPGPVWIVEMSNLGRRYGFEGSEVVQVFEKLGYRSFRYVAGENSFTAHDPTRDAGNVIYARDAHAIVDRLRGGAEPLTKSTTTDSHG